MFCLTKKMRMGVIDVCVFGGVCGLPKILCGAKKRHGSLTKPHLI